MFRPLAGLLLVAALVVAGRPAGAATPLALNGGDVRSLAFDPRDPQRAFAGTVSGQIFRSDDGGASWSDAGVPAPFPGRVVAALEFDAERPGRLWAALWGLWGGGGVARSDDAGVTWSWRADPSWVDDPVYAVLAAPGRPDRLYAGTRRGVWRSDDAGGSWRRLATEVEGLVHVSSLAVDPRAPERLLAGTWRRAFRSDDGGASWRGVFDGMVLDTEVFRLAHVPGEPGRLWASTCGWVYRGDDFGASWRRVKTGLDERRTPALTVVSAERVIAGTVAGVYLSLDGGESFRLASAPTLSVVALAHHPAAPAVILAATDGAGIWRSTDGGSSFQPASLGLAATRVVAVVAERGAVYAAVHFAGPLSGVYRSTDGGASFARLGAELPTVTGLALAEGELLAATERGLWVLRGAEWSRVAELGERRIDALLRRLGSADALVDGRIWRWRAGRAVALEGAESVVEPRPRGVVAAGGGAELRLEAGIARLVVDGRSVRVALPFPVEAVLDAAIDGERLLLATSGFGLRSAPLPSYSASSESSMRR
jgi:photosystem II stability/assembly factor-like uncharacterized protein